MGSLAEGHGHRHHGRADAIASGCRTAPPQAPYEQRPGRWVAEAAGPRPRLDRRRLASARPAGDAAANAAPRLPIRLAAIAVGLAAGEWCPYGCGPRDADRSAGRRRRLARLRLGHPGRGLEILGAPRRRAGAGGRPPDAPWWPCGSATWRPTAPSTRVTYGLLNLHPSRRATPQPGAGAGRALPGHGQLNDVAPSLRRRPLACASRSPPTTGRLAWPSPEPVTLTMFAGAGNAWPCRCARACRR